MPDSTKKPLVIFIYAVLILSTLLVYWQVHNFDFVNYDDDAYVYENQHVLSGLTWDGLKSAFTSAPAGGNWLPLTWLSFMLDCQLFGPVPGRMHLVNVLFHLANTLLLFAVLKKMTGSLWASAFVAAAFALHPMHVESVAWITERKDVLSTFFLLLTLAAYTRYTRSPSVYRYMTTLALFAMGLMAKPMLVTLPLVLLLLDYWPLNRFDRQPAKTAGRQSRKHDEHGILYAKIVEKIPFFVLSAISSIIAFLTQQVGGSTIDIKTIPLMDRVGNVFLSYAKYIARMFWPQDLAVFYPFNAHTIRLWQVVFCILLLVGVSLLVLRLGRTRKYLPVGWFLFVGTLVPVIGLVQVGGQAFADRYTYIPYIGLFIMIAWGLPELLSKWAQRNFALGICTVIALAAMGIYAHRQASYWNNSITLFSHAIEVTQDNYLAYNDRGDAYIRLGRLQEAIVDFSEAIRVKPSYADAYTNLGTVYTRLGRWRDAIDAQDQAIKIDPYYAKAYNNRGVTYDALGRWDEAIADYSKAIWIEPDNIEAHNNRGAVYINVGRAVEAIADCREAIRIKPDCAEAYKTRGIAYGRLGRGTEAIEDFTKALKIDPGNADARFSLAGELAGLGRWDEAASQYRAVLKVRGGWAEPMNNLALIIAINPDIKNRDTNEAVRLARGACELADYKNAAFLGTLAAAQASAGKFSEAVDTANKSISLADAANQPQLKGMIQHHLSFYKQGKPYIEPAQKPLPNGR